MIAGPLRQGGITRVYHSTWYAPLLLGFQSGEAPTPGEMRAARDADALAGYRAHPPSEAILLEMAARPARGRLDLDAVAQETDCVHMLGDVLSFWTSAMRSDNWWSERTVRTRDSAGSQTIASPKSLDPPRHPKPILMWANDCGRELAEIGPSSPALLVMPSGPQKEP
ncbi:hypothetical protein [Burkholderia sp. Nafp2/4-1b]|uniref:hypothetical protein n=1 Tax=Burkholderia sp. Nafp2/4-1b TaxID=2116686 RepID=UPI0013CF2B27|nr:hypothetical protein [Burkholderia sp. Nafp2/4-1b]